jgi:hypothetical protein
MGWRRRIEPKNRPFVKPDFSAAPEGLENEPEKVSPASSFVMSCPCHQHYSRLE